MDGGQRAALVPYEQYLGSVGDGLRRRGYDRRTDGPADYETDVYHRRTLSLTKLGYVDYFVVAGEFDSLTKDEARAFSKACYKYGLDNKSPLPRGFGGTLVVVPVIAGEDVAEPVRQWVGAYEPKHWGAFELPVVVDLATVKAAHNTSKPLWGRAYYSVLEDLVDDCLAPSVGQDERARRR